MPIAAMWRPRSGSGTAGSGGTCVIENVALSSSGAASVRRRKACSNAGACSTGHTICPPKISATGKSASSIAVTIPNEPPPPRIAQNSSGSVSASTVTSSPRAFTSSTARTEFAAWP